MRIQLKEKISKVLFAFESPKQLLSVLFWPKFSLSSYLVISSLIRQGIKPATVIDVGANVGQFAISASKLFTADKIISFEPDPQAAEIFKKNTILLKNIELHQKALGTVQGTAEFFVNKDSQVSSMLALSHERLKEFPGRTVTSSIAVDVDTLDNMFCKEILQKPILLKIDVQGFEDRVLLGARSFLKNVDFVLLELSLKSLYEGEKTFNEMIYLMEGLGFEFARPLNWNMSPRNGEMIEMDALFVSSNRGVFID
jgi:FkbM family methyltransferase